MARHLETGLEILHASASFEQAYYGKCYKVQSFPPNFDSKHAPITATFKSSFVKFAKRKVLNSPKTYKWDNQGAVLFHCLLNQKDTQDKLGKLRFGLDSSSKTNAIQKAVKQFTESISECGDKTLRI